MHSTFPALLFAAALLTLPVAVTAAADSTGIPAGSAAKPVDTPDNGNTIDSIRGLLHNGNPKLAESKAYGLLKAGKVDDRQRRSLLRIIAVAEEMQTALHDYTDARPAIDAWQNLLREFVSPDDAAGIRWKICWLYWKMGDEEGAIRAADELLKESPNSKQARQAQLLLARIDINGNKLNNARRNLMNYMLDTTTDTEQAEGLAWMAVVDFRDHRVQQAYKNISKAIGLAPGLVSSEEPLLSTYVQILYELNNIAAFQHQAGRYLDLYLDRPDGPLVRLMLANVLLQTGKDKAAEKAYERLSLIAPETSIGRKAFMRKLMLQNADTTDFEALKPVLAALHTLAVRNQISDIEDEAMLDQARLWSRLVGKVDHAGEKALDLYTQVTVGTTPRFARAARAEGFDLFEKHIAGKLADKAWLESIVLWRRYPQLRESPVPLQGDALKTQRNIIIGVAGAMRRLMDFSSAEELLQALYQQTQDSVEGDRVMLDLARLWLDRHDKDGYAKVMRWLNAHTFTLYRPEMMLVAAHMQLQEGQPNQASQSIQQVAEEDITPAMRPDYWRCKAEIAEALEQWHSAARDWANHIRLLDKVPTDIRQRHADALYQAGEFADAEKEYNAMPEDARDNRWQYRVAVCEMRTGQWSQAEERLTALSKNKDAGEFAQRAHMLLVEREATGLMEQY